MQLQLVPGYYGFAAIVDDHFLTEEPIESIQKGKINVESFMIGVTQNEGTYIG